VADCGEQDILGEALAESRFVALVEIGGRRQKRISGREPTSTNFGNMYANVQMQSCLGEERMPKTGNRCTEFGVFSSDCCGSEIVIGPGVLFPACAKHPGMTTWVNIQREAESIPDGDQQAA
jgi:hypothetical protein